MSGDNLAKKASWQEAIETKASGQKIKCHSLLCHYDTAKCVNFFHKLIRTGHKKIISEEINIGKKNSSYFFYPIIHSFLTD